jgi:hypothetical protein
VGTLIRKQFNHSRATATKDGDTRAYKRTVATLGDVVIRVFEELIQKMLQISKAENKQTIGINTFMAAAKLIPGINTLSAGSKAWNSVIDGVVSYASNSLEGFGKKKPAAEREGDLNLNQYMAESGFYVRPTALRALVKARLPCRWRLGGGDLTSIAFSIFCCTIAETLLTNVGEQFDASTSQKTESLAPRHLAKAVDGFEAIKSIVGNAVIIGTPLVRRPQIGRKVKRSRKSSAGGAPKAKKPASRKRKQVPKDVAQFIEGEASESEEEEVPLKRRRHSPLVVEDD